MTTLDRPTLDAAGELISMDPATGEAVGRVPVTPAAAVPAVVARARAAQPAWAALTTRERAERLRPLGDALVAAADDLGALLSREMGKPIAEAKGEVSYCGRETGAKLDEIIGALEPDLLDDGKVRSHIHHDPLGVCAVITPWNFPIAMPHETVIPALAAGNTVVLKPSEETPLIAQAYADLLAPLVPDGVFQIVHGADAQGKALVAANVNLIAFTGSRETGKAIMKQASDGLKRVILELGGKDPLIVLDDADLDAASAFAARNSFRNAGQVCVSTERIYVSERVADDFERQVLEKARALKVGPGLDPDTNIGPMINGRQRDHVVAQIEAARGEGATVAFGGEPPHGNFITPTVLTNVTHDMGIMREETFGPVACIMRVKDDDEAVRLANDTPFGLGAAVFGAPEHAERVARGLTAGMIGINQGCGGATGAPWIGAQESGYGYHSGPAGHRQFTQSRVVSRRI